MKKTAILLLLSLCSGLFVSCGRLQTLYIYADDSQIMAEYDGVLTVYDQAYEAYAKYALEEASDLLAENGTVKKDKALQYMRKKGIAINTYASLSELNSLKEVSEAYFPGGETELSCALTDEEGRLTAIYSSEGAVKNTYAGSSIKPLSVYAPGIESGLIHWSDMQHDSPYKQVTDETGTYDWPANGTGIYTEKNITAADAVRNSVNTAAVKWLSEYGVSNAIGFLTDNFGMRLDEEIRALADAPEEELLGAVGLGYLREGVNVCEMAGYYRIFSDKGVYTVPHALKSLSAPDGTLLAPEEKTKQVVSEETAFILNRMLKGVIDSGTGTAAKHEGFRLVGKTGTSDNFEDNWFIGVTPERTAAIRHSRPADGGMNHASEIFTKISEKISFKTEKEFPPCPENVVQKVCCPETGKLVSDNCPGIIAGYFRTDEVPDVCDQKH